RRRRRPAAGRSRSRTATVSRTGHVVGLPVRARQPARGGGRDRVSARLARPRRFPRTGLVVERRRRRNRAAHGDVLRGLAAGGTRRRRGAATRAGVAPGGPPLRRPPLLGGLPARRRAVAVRAATSGPAPA